MEVIRRKLKGLSYFRQGRTDNFLETLKTDPVSLIVFNILAHSYLLSRKLIRRVTKRKGVEISPFRYPDTEDLAVRYSSLQVFPAPFSKNYQVWHALNSPRPSDLRQMKDIQSFFSLHPLISVIIPVYNGPEQFLRDAIDSVRAQIYPHWELCIADDASTQEHVKTVLEEYSRKDKRIKVIYRQENGHISRCSNSALSLAQGEFVALLDQDDLLTPDALFQVVKVINQHPDADLIYSDEDKVDQLGYLRDPYFKPGWSPDSFLCRMYICHLSVYRRQFLDDIGGFRAGYEGAQDYDLALRFTEKTDRIHHIPKILYHWRIHPQSTAGSVSNKDYVIDAGFNALSAALERRKESGKIIPVWPGHWIIRYDIEKMDKVTVIIPTKNLGSVLNTCLKSIFEKTTYPNFEVLVIDNGSTEVETLEVLSGWQQQEPERFRREILDIPFNFSKLNNYGVSLCQESQYVILLNNDTEVIEPEWMTAMVEQAQRPSIGAVGARLLYPDDTIQHAGIILGICGLSGHSHKHAKADSLGYFCYLESINNVSAVTGACLMCRRDVYLQVGGLDEDLVIALNDIDYCLKLLSKGYMNIYLPHVKLYHHESKSRGYENTIEKRARFQGEIEYLKGKWGEWLIQDSYYNPNLTDQREGFSVKTQHIDVF